MKVLESSILSGPYDGTEEENQNIRYLVDNSCSRKDSKFSFTKIEEEAGWTYITCMINESEFLIKYSSYMSDASVLAQFFADIIDMEEDIILFLDYEGSDPMLYANKIDDDNVRFIFAHDYNLFLNDDIEEYTVKDYKIECDIIIRKKDLLANFYNIFYPFTINYDVESAKEAYYDDVFNLANGKKYLNIIKEYLNK